MDISPTALFDSYEQDFWQFIATIREKVEANGTEDANGGGEFAYRQHFLTSLISAYQRPTEQKKTTWSRVEMELDEADEMVSH